MPTYDYKCKTCNQVFEHIQSMKDDPLEECLCGKAGKVERMISFGGGIIFKGSGFYVTDYKSNSSDGSSTQKNTNSTETSSGNSSNSSGSSSNNSAQS
ncbi:FmdB family transcriptional regulator [Leptospira perolatii]|uniref:FmdB family transcriptional regulator n=1 Tax=Leptospira perolatii TaxID=2023191 RepID=A0A2M9ZJW1_9LEPT|nr:zinc ribbon domain-containing protein [Leptospira perolatii]PJZ69262.1 FmdB family transcriptional regulator [Leptospira perolatii]PJZ72356.1 FmdB family transcriptional regulator [Leptospira perolatii]